jgi:DNA-binding NtrC family response regulator
MSINISVVIAEDDVLVRMAAVDALRDEGFEVFEAGNAEEALIILRARASGTHVLFTDIHMPGQMDGLALAYHTGRSWPWVALIIASGVARPHASDLPANSRFLPKPYVVGNIVSHIHQMVALNAAMQRGTA